MGGPVVSIIIPIYNVEEYLEQCLESVINQTLQDIEIICVNDGSSDSSPRIIDVFANRDARIVVINKPNGGYGQAVNRGLEAASGTWVGIVEPDDFVDINMFEDLVRNAYLEDGGMPEIVKSAYWEYYDGALPGEGYVKVPPVASSMRPRRYEFDVLHDTELLYHHPSIWSAIYLRSFLNEHGIRMIEPPGAGWADNPWFFDTMLRARNIVWIPSAYYYYRQTNANASTNVKDYHVVFDRLRDIRGIYSDLAVSDKRLLAALYWRELSYITNTLFNVGNFPEADSEIQALVHEVIDAMDDDIVFMPRNGIVSALREYYRDNKGKKIETVKVRAAVESPLFSIVVALKDDSRGIWETLDCLLAQDFEAFEVLLIDCHSNDRGPSIASGVSRLDGRFKLIDASEGSVGGGFAEGLAHAKGEYVGFLRPGVCFKDKVFFSKLRNALEENEATDSLDVLVGDFSFARFRESRFQVDSELRFLECSNSQEYVAANLAPAIYGKFFRREYLKESNAQFSRDGDDDGYAFNVAAFAHAHSAALVGGLDLGLRTRELIALERFKDEADLVNYELARIHAMANAARADGSDSAWRVARGCIVRAMRDALERKGELHSGRKLFEELKRLFKGAYGLANVPKPYYGNYPDYLALEAAFSMPYEVYCECEDERRQARLCASEREVIRLRRHRDIYRTACQKAEMREAKLKEQRNDFKKECKQLRKELASIKQSRSYKLIQFLK